jgi:hypothetical protein
MQVARNVPRRPPQTAIESSRQGAAIREEIEGVLQEYAGVGGLDGSSQQVRRRHLEQCSHTHARLYMYIHIHTNRRL